MKKILAFLLLISSLFLLVGCHNHTYESQWASDANEHWHGATCHEGEKTDVSNHTWRPSGSADADGSVIYDCSVCGYVHQHVYDGENWAFNGREHWRPLLCGHADAPVLGEEHLLDADGICSLCGCDTKEQSGYEVAFAYYVVDETGTPVVDENGSYTQVGVTYNSVIKNGSLPIDTVNGATLYGGDKISFTVEKSVFCYYTDDADQCLVEVIVGDEEGNRSVETLYPDEEGVYTLEITGDTVVTVVNVATSSSTIDGSGTQDDPYTINSVVDWLYFAMYVNSGSSLNYNVAYWQLTTDLDFEGESIYVVGDGYSTSNSVFCGNFDGGGYTISNFVLDNAISSSVGQGYTNYLGLFGVMTGYVGVDSVIANLNLENAVVNATADVDNIVSAGCILGYGVGANVVNCKVTNCQINVIADDTYMSYAGGIVGYLQSGMTSDGILFYSSVSYSVAENIAIKGTGMLYNAGGIAGRVVSYNSQVTSFITNCYTSGSISDGVRAGGVVGELQRYGAIQNCYSTAKVSAHSAYNSTVDASFDGTAYDDRYSYAGGVVGYVENDTVVQGCFFDGATYATAVAGNGFGKKGNVMGGFSAEGFADYYANAVVGNNHDGTTAVTNDYLKNQFNYNEADWVFGDGYPTINQEEVSHSFTVTINVDGVTVDVREINSQYIPLSYWYILGDNNVASGIARCYQHPQQQSKRTYGYYFDASLTQPVPVGYVPMTNVTLYASYVDTTPIVGNYYISSNGVSALLCISGDGTYYYEEGAILLHGNYQFDGKVITFDNSFFSRLAPTATATQRSSYYRFWAQVQPNGDLSIYDCKELYIVTEENEAQNSNFASMARFYTYDNPLVAISQQNVKFDGGYYYTDNAGAKHLFEFGKDNTGVYTKYLSNGTSTTDTFAVKVTSDTSATVTLAQNGKRFTLTIGEDGLWVDGMLLIQMDGFAGSWEKQATSHKTYTFDGMGGWTYQHYVYLVEQNVVTATKQIVESDFGSYVVDASGSKISFVRNGVSVVATLVDGEIFVTEDGQPVQVQFVGANSYKGVWYTASNKIVRYTLTLEGLGSNGVGNATLDGFGAQPLQLRYTAVSSDTLYLYIDDVVYAILQYSAKTGLFEGLFYSSSTGSATTEQTLYLYDDFAGSWVSDIEGISALKFNGFGAYDTTDVTGNTLAVKGNVTLTTSSGEYTLQYTLDRATEKATFTWKNVNYLLSYNEYSNVISVTYGNNQKGAVAKADDYLDVALLEGNVCYTFDGRGNLANGGVVTANGVNGVYKIQNDGSILMQFDGQADKTIVCNSQNDLVTYTLQGQTLHIDNAFTGKWAIPGENLSIEVGLLVSISASGSAVQFEGNCLYNGRAVNMYYDGQNTVTFHLDGITYTLTNTLGGKASALILSQYPTNDPTDATEKIIVSQDDFLGVWTKSNNKMHTLTFDGCGLSDYVVGKVSDQQLPHIYKRTYKIVDGVVTIYDANGNKYATFVECQKDEEGNYVNTDGAYVNGERYYQLELA